VAPSAGGVLEGIMANRSETDRAGRGYWRQPQGWVEVKGREDEGAPGGQADVSSPGSAWERMLDALTGDEKEAPANGSLRASIAERLHTRGGSPMNDQGQREAPQVQPVRRRRR
jgi:hypothetical protein